MAATARKASRKSASKRAAAAPPPFRVIRGKFDSAQTNENNRRHWANADGLSADAAANAADRRKLRERARYEVANNCYAQGIVTSLANDIIGTGPRLQLADKSAASTIERDWSAWMRAVSLAEKLRTMIRAWTTDGEAFGLKTYNPAVEHAIKLDLRLIECDQVTSPWQDAAVIDGITLDSYGNVAAYSVLKEHPGGLNLASIVGEYLTVLARDMVHLFSVDRPGQHRGVPLLTPALQLFPQMRRFTLAVLTAAECAADFAGMLYTDSPPNDEAVAADPMDIVNLERGTFMTLPAGWKMSQVEPMQPATTYPEFKRQILSESARPLGMPYNVAAGDSSSYNYSSGRLDHQTYDKAMTVNRDLVAAKVLDPIFAAWKREYAFATGRTIAATHQWFWDGRGHVDPVKEATAQQIRLQARTTTLRDEYAAEGKDWEAQLDQIGLEAERMRELGITSAQAAPVPAPGDQPKEDEA